MKSLPVDRKLCPAAVTEWWRECWWGGCPGGRPHGPARRPGTSGLRPSWTQAPRSLVHSQCPLCGTVIQPVRHAPVKHNSIRIGIILCDVTVGPRPSSQILVTCLIAVYTYKNYPFFVLKSPVSFLQEIRNNQCWKNWIWNILILKTLPEIPDDSHDLCYTVHLDVIFIILNLDLEIGLRNAPTI